MHMKFQVNILCSSGIMRGDRPTDRPSEHPTLWIVGIRGESKKNECTQLHRNTPIEHEPMHTRTS